MSEESTWVGGDGSFGDMSTAPESIQSLVSNKSFAGVEDLATAYSNLEGMKGDWSNPASMKLPEEFTPEQLDSLNTRRGVPESSDSYAWETDSKVKMDDGLMGEWRGAAKELGMSQDQFKGVMDFYAKMSEDQQKQLDDFTNSSMKKSVAELKENWGDKYDTNVEMADNIAKKLEISGELESLGLLSNPSMIKALQKIGMATEEGTLHGSNIQTQKTKDEEMKEITSNPAFTDNMHPEHDAVYQRFLKIQGITT